MPGDGVDNDCDGQIDEEACCVNRDIAGMCYLLRTETFGIHSEIVGFVRKSSDLFGNRRVFPYVFIF